MDISIKEAADLLGKSQRTVRHMAQTGRIPARRIGSRWLIRQADAEAIKAGKDPMASFLDDEEADGPVSAASEAARPAAAPRPTFTISFDSSLEQSGDRSVHEITELRDLDTFAIASGLLAEVAYLRHDGPCDTMLLEHVEQSMCGILEVLADALQQHDPSSRVERFRQAQRQACSALTGLLHYNMVYAEPDLSSIVTHVEKDLLPSLRELVEETEKRARWRGRAITAAEHVVERVLTRVRHFAGDGRMATGLGNLQQTLSRALEAAL